MTYSFSRRLFAWSAAAILAAGIAAPHAAADTLLSGFEGNLSSSAGPSWTTGLPHSFVPGGATEGASAIQITHNTSWTQSFLLQSVQVAALIAANDKFEFDVTTPATQSWREVFVVMNGDGKPWQAYPFAPAPGATTHFALDLVATGVKAIAANNPTWWEMEFIFQGGDTTGAPQINTTLDNLKFTAIPEPATCGLAAAAMLGLFVVRRKRS
jgi:hypothetical protein